MGTSGKIVWQLIQPLLGKGYHLYVDNFYTSLPLFRHLYLKQTVACGTARTNRKGFPQILVTKKLKQGEMASMRTDEVLAVKWRDKKRDVYILSTIHNDTLVELQRRKGPIQKPKCIHEYNLYMGGVDMNDQMMQPYLATRRSLFWYKKVAVYLMQLAMFNSYIIFSKSTQSSLTYLRFQEDVITALVYPHGQPTQLIRSDAVARLHERHFPDILPPTQTGRKPQKRCRVCTSRGIRRDTRYYCPDCPSQPGLCIGTCYRSYHTSLHY